MMNDDIRVTGTSHKMLILNAVAFTVCFACWMLNGVLVTFLVDRQVFHWGPVEIGWLMGIPVLTGSIFRLPAGMLTDRFGGKWVYGLLLLGSALPMFLLSRADSFLGFALCSFGFGLTGTSFSIGIAYTSVWYPRRWQGTALGIFGAGNAGAAITTLVAPTLLRRLTGDGANIEGWRTLPQLYALALVLMGLAFLLIATNRRAPGAQGRGWISMLSPLRSVRVWRFGLYYFLVFGCFVALSQWLVPYFLNVYSVSLVTAGLFASAFSLPSGLIRALGGWMSDRWGARQVMYWVLGASVVSSLLLIVPRMEIYSPGSGIMAGAAGRVEAVTDQAITIATRRYAMRPKPERVDREREDRGLLVFPQKQVWQEPLVKAGDQVQKKQLIARGVTRIFFQANIWIALALIFVIGIVWGIGKAAVYKYIPEYFPNEVGVVGGMVGVLGGLGGFCGPIIFGYLLEGTGLWTSMWMFLALLSLACLAWMHAIVRRISRVPVGFDAHEVRPFEWNAAALDTGVPTMDAEHRRLVGSMNELISANNFGASKDELLHMLNELGAYIQQHFTHEEDYLASIDYAELEAHRHWHGELLEKFGHFKHEFKLGPGRLSEAFFEFLKLWLNQHIQGADRRYGDAAQARQAALGSQALVR